MPAPREAAHGAVAALAAAGNDTEALAQAIEKAAFLEETPGEDRQKLRGNQLHIYRPVNAIIRVSGCSAS